MKDVKQLYGEDKWRGQMRFSDGFNSGKVGKMVLFRHIELFICLTI